MPHVKIDYVVSFSSEDPENPASNLLLSDVKSKWLCKVGEPSCSVVLQLKSACKIDSITIGAYHVALIEVLVGLSEKHKDPFQVLVPSCVLLSPPASRRGENVECVRTFGAAQLASAAGDQRWDRVRLVCSQPYNKHCKYGLAFVHISSPDSQSFAFSAPPATVRCLLEAEGGSSDDEFRPGELFAQHRIQLSQSTAAQIRQASSQALKNIPDASTKLTKTPISRTSNTKPRHTDDQQSDRTKISLLYTDDDGEPHQKIDRVVRVHNINRKQNKTIEDNKTINKPNTDQSDRDKLNISRPDSAMFNSSKVNDDPEPELKERDTNKPPHKKGSERNASNDMTDNAAAGRRKLKRSSESLTVPSAHLSPGPVCAALGEVLAGVAVALSGYVHPQRAELRRTALELGARYLRDWEPACTHLICAFPNTPKMRAAVAAGAPTVAVLGEWLLQCRQRRRRLPWRWFATEPRQRVPEPQATRQQHHESEDDTDDEIEKVLKQQCKKVRRYSSPDRTQTNTHRDDQTDVTDHTNPTDVTDHIDHTDHTDGPSEHGHTDAAADADETMDVSRDSDVAFVRDERVKAQISLHSDSDATDEDERAEHPDSVEIKKELPNVWEGCTFVVSQSGWKEPSDAALLTRYIRAYGGLVLQESEVLDDSSVQYVVEAGAGLGTGVGEREGTRRVCAEWVWRQHAQLRHL